LTKYSHFEFSSARELDDKVADELEAMERNSVLPKRWNGSAEREHLNTQHRAWTHAKKKDRDDKLAHHNECTVELQTLSTQQTESLNLDKSLQAQIKALRDNHDIDWKERIKALQQQVEDEKEKRRGFKNRRQVINVAIQELKDNGLSGSRINGHRPALSVEIKAVENELCDAPGMLSLDRTLMPLLKYYRTGDSDDLSMEPVLPIPPMQVNLDEHPPNVQGTPLVEVEDGLRGMLSFDRTLTPLKYWHTEDNGNLSTGSVLPVPAVPVNLDDHPQNIYGTPVKSFLEMLNSNDDDYNNFHTGGSLIFLSMQYTAHWDYTLVGLFPDTLNASGVNDMNSGANFEVDFNFNFNDFDFGNMDNFNFENTDSFDLRNMENFDFGNMEIDTLKFDNLGVDTTFIPEQAFIFPPQPAHFDADMVLPIDPSTNHSSPASTSNTSMFNTPTLPKSDMVHVYQPMKRKKVDEVDAAHILPEGLQRRQTKSAKAAATLESAEE